MDTVIVVPPHDGRTGPEEQIRLLPGDSLAFGRAVPRGGMAIAHEGVSRVAGEITAHPTFWSLSNLSRDRTYVVENPEGAGEHIKIAPGRLGAPVSFEFARVVLPATHDLVTFDVWAPGHDYLDRDHPGRVGAPTASAFPLDRGARYFLVLAALCEPRLRGEPYAPLPTAEQLVERLRGVWPEANRGSVQWNVDYLAEKLRLRPSEAYAPRRHGKKETLVALALRFDLVREDDMHLLAGEVLR
ncbi:hypothetical protein SLINC_4071 [Streptomyces lincolnensis]|uniref:Uncharacterized protein n=1 Tax=Streptomyces lincolnensis TaxID=1915 RepID=A0A1B1MCD9_STRLN|nr:hypothetical protein [Streptomyces lincolnensis]ANS66295.1 hypothetical protein SLINC_4071 [Streptomyces lincolnensis]AXG55165.1 hypothetical protein SLCG_4010 [Streptomyces lincolnensis]QMV08323.1 FHA domain-containing protein [Streptomyces lincolnensis]